MKVALRLPSSDAIKYPKEVGGCKKKVKEQSRGGTVRKRKKNMAF